MFKRRDIPPVLLLLLLIILVMLTLSQILVVHNGRYGRNVHSMRRLQLELRELDLNLHALMMQNVPSIELSRRLLQNQINAQRVAKIIAEAKKPDGHGLPESRRRLIGLPALSPPPVKLSAHPDPAEEEEEGGEVGRVDAGEREERRGVRGEKSQSRGGGGGGGGQFSEHNVHFRLRHPQESIGHGDPGDPGDPPPPPSFPGAANPAIGGDNVIQGPVDEARTDNSRASHQGRDAHGRNSNTITMAFTQTGDHTSGRGGGGVRREEVAGGGGQRHLRPDCAAGNCSLITGTKPGAAAALVPVPLDTQHPPPTSHAAAHRIQYCPAIPPSLTGKVFIHMAHSHNMTEEEIIRANPEVGAGGMRRPAQCVARHKVAVIVPYRDRAYHLRTLLAHLHPILQRQQLDYRIFVVEQQGRDTFNKARIMNIAFVEALKQYNFQCFVFHDVDLVPEDDRNMYSCPRQPRHMSVAIDEMGYKLAYQELVGGVLNMRTEHFQRVNGYSNLYWGWGAEDDDMAYRIMHVGLKITRPPEALARYTMIKHTKRKPSDWRKRAKLLYTGTRRFQFDGLNSLQYKLVHVEKRPLYTHVLVDVGRPPRGF